MSKLVDLVKHRRDPDVVATVTIWREPDGTIKWSGEVTARTEFRVPWAMANAAKALDDYTRGIRHRERIPERVRRRRHRVASR
jgi:hypothetical protein